jgi:2'-5' RNA ligase
VLRSLAALPRPAAEGVRWTTSEQWHVTLVFLGEVEDGAGPELATALADALADAPADGQVALGPATVRLGPGLLVLPATGLAPLAARLAPLGPAQDRPFRGHLTLARAGRGRRVPAGWAGAPFRARFPVGPVALVRSHLGPGGARYQTLAAVRPGARAIHHDEHLFG